MVTAAAGGQYCCRYKEGAATLGDTIVLRSISTRAVSDNISSMHSCAGDGAGSFLPTEVDFLINICNGLLSNEEEQAAGFLLLLAACSAAASACIAAWRRPAIAIGSQDCARGGGARTPTAIRGAP